MSYLSDIEIAQKVKASDIKFIAEKAGIDEKYLIRYGYDKAKIELSLINDLKDSPDGKLVLVTAITPTPAGEGKTTTTIGLGDALRKIGKKSVIAMREPSLGPVFGLKGGAAGGGYAQVIPMEDINLHFTGDIHAIGAANNLLAAIIDNHIHHGNSLNIDPRRITWKRAVDINDRQLRNIICGLGGVFNGVPREDGFDITVASEIMAIFCLASGIEDLKKRLARIVIGFTYDGKPVKASDLRAEGAMTALLKDAIRPNLVQTLEGTPAFVHGGPFANIAHGCNSVIATKMALKLGEFAITEAGFGADLGAEKFFDIKCRLNGLRPSAAVIVASVRALKIHGGALKGELSKEDIGALERGMPNLLQHADNITRVFGLPSVVAINRFPSDTDREIALIKEKCASMGINAVTSDVWAKGGNGGIELAEEVVRICDEPANFNFAYDVTKTIKEKLNDIAQKIYRADGVKITGNAVKQLAMIEENSYGDLPICMAKTPYSFSDDQSLTCAPQNFYINVSNLKVSAGAGFIVALTGEIRTMPGLPKIPAAENIDVDENGVISGLF